MICLWTLLRANEEEKGKWREMHLLLYFLFFMVQKLPKNHCKKQDFFLNQEKAYEHIF